MKVFGMVQLLVVSGRHKGSVYKDFNESVKHHFGENKEGPDTTAPRITVADLYGNRRRWRQAYFFSQ